MYLVGAGPGDPGLLTLKGKDCIAKADVVIYDNLANRAFLQHARQEAELVYVGKKGGCHTLAQEEINRLIVEKASQGLIVVRLKGGDPFIFGRGGEEAQELVRAGVAFEIVPGVTSAIAVPAYAGIPLTHRDHTSAVAFITGHEDPKKEGSSIHWESLSTCAGTLVFLMGVANLSAIVARLLDGGLSPDTPVAAIHMGTMAAQKTVVGTLSTISEIARKHDLHPPAVIVVGDVVRLREELDWFERRPLFGRRIVVTRAREQASAFLERLSLLGAECIEFPTIQILPPESWEALDKAIEVIDSYDWILFTSVNGAKYFLERLSALGKDVRDLKGIRIGAIGPKTAEVWIRMGIRPDLVPNEYRAEAVVESIGKWGVRGARVLLPRAAGAREVLPEELAKMGAQVQVVTTYRTLRPDQEKGRLREMLSKGEIDMVTFTSSSTVHNFIGMFDDDQEELKTWMAKTAVACIGPVTASTAEHVGLRVRVMPSRYTIEALEESIVRYFSGTDADSSRTV